MNDTLELSVKPSDSMNSQCARPNFETSSHSVHTDDIYRMVYKDRSKIETIHFHYSAKVDLAKYADVEQDKLHDVIARDKLQVAIARCKRYCENMRYRFIHCELFLVNLEEKERVAAANY